MWRCKWCKKFKDEDPNVVRKHSITCGMKFVIIEKDEDKNNDDKNKGY